MIVLAVVAITLVGMLLRLRWFGDSLYGDEVEAFYDVSGHGLGRVIHIVNGHGPELSPPLYFILAWFSEQLFGTSVQSLRIVSMASGIATVPLTYVLGRWTISARAGLMAAACAALSPFLIFFGSEARPYSLLVALCLVSTLALLKAIDTGRHGWWIAYAAASCAAIYTHYVAVFPLIVQFAWAVGAHPQVRRPLLVANLAVVAGFSPWIPTLISEAGSPGTKIYALLEPFTFRAVRTDLAHLWIGARFQPLDTVPGRVGIGLALAGIAVALAGVIRGSFRRDGSLLKWPSRRAALILVLAFGVPLSAALYSGVRRTVWNAWDLMPSWPAFAVCVGVLITSAWNRWRAVAAAAVIAGFAIGSVKMLDSHYHRPDYAAVVAYILKASRNPRAPVVNVPDLSPGPTVELEVAFAVVNPRQRHPVLRLGRAPLAVESRTRAFTPLDAEPGQEVARQAAQRAGSGKLFLVLPGALPIATLKALRRARGESSSPYQAIRAFVAFMRALPTRFHLAAAHSYTGMHRVSVYTFQG